MSDTTTGVLKDVAERIRELRIDSGYSLEELSEHTGFALEDCRNYEAGEVDLPFSFIHKCALTFGVEMMDLLEGHSPRLTSYAVTRRGGGQVTSREKGTEIRSIAHLFKNRKADPYWVRYEYSEEEQNAPIRQTTHGGQEFDLVLEGRMKVKVGDHTEILGPGDSIFYNSSTPHGMIAIDGADCVFCAVILADDDEVMWDHGRLRNVAQEAEKAVLPAEKKPEPDFMAGFIKTEADDAGTPKYISFSNADRFNFAFDVVDAIADREPDRLAMVHLDSEKRERRFTFGDMKKMSARSANYFRALGVKKGDRVMLIMRRNWEFWPVIVGLNKLGAIAIPATDQLLQKDLEYRFNTAEVSAVVCSAEGECSKEVEKAAANCESVKLLVMSGGSRDGWHDFDAEYEMYSSHFDRTEDTVCGDDSMLMLFTSGTSGYPKAALHSCKYPLGHYITAKYWHNADPDGLHFTISDTGWGKALWGKLYGQWMCGTAVFVYDFERFRSEDILPMFAKYNITTFCAPPTMYRFFIKEDLGKYDLS
ncbi:MAG: AMP-binding protein, partial [Oscillospiraceae bacterium]|nr:AMP-binding protein [Oscillospiraceae bacterium]